MRRVWRGVSFFRGSLGLFVAFNALAFGVAAWYYRGLLEYCEGENRALGTSGIECVEGYSWWFIYMMLFAWLVMAALLAALVVYAYRGRRGPDIANPS